jgi:hypothetical protein
MKNCKRNRINNLNTRIPKTFEEAWKSKNEEKYKDTIIKNKKNKKKKKKKNYKNFYENNVMKIVENKNNPKVIKPLYA